LFGALITFERRDLCEHDAPDGKPDDQEGEKGDPNE
jgi:hypothetical protein